MVYLCKPKRIILYHFSIFLQCELQFSYKNKVVIYSKITYSNCLHITKSQYNVWQCSSVIVVGCTGSLAVCSGSGRGVLYTIVPSGLSWRPNYTRNPMLLHSLGLAAFGLDISDWIIILNLKLVVGNILFII